jgi:FtsP/CotA-like multicopper oxidase with cupredoxin domain
MNASEIELHHSGNQAPTAGPASRWFRLLSVASTLVAAIFVLALPARAQSTAAAPAAPSNGQIACPRPQQPLVKIPELVSKDGRLRATVVATSEFDRVGTRTPARLNGGATQPGDPNAYTACFGQWLRAFRSPDAVPPFPTPGTEAAVGDPLNGPTLRARVGDVIELSFLNNIDPGVFGKSIDAGDGDPGACDQTFGATAIKNYPGTDPKGDKYPNCFHGSTTANIHFHGTHTNPNSTGDNVFLEILSSLRQTGKPVVTPDSVKKDFDDFFQRCELELGKGSHREWPRRYLKDMPADWVARQKSDLTKFDSQPGAGKALSPVNDKQIEEGAWPQYYLGSYPYCFKLPAWPETPVTPATATHSHDGTGELAGSAARTLLTEAPNAHALKMGQAPGTHWYHAHKHGSTAIDIGNGFVGAFIIEGQYDDELAKFYKTDTPPTAGTPAVPQWSLNPAWSPTVLVINQFGTSINLKNTAGGQDKGPDFSVNGRVNPVISMRPGEVQMWRIVNASGRAGSYFIGPPPGFHWRQLAQDGVQFKDVNYQASADRPFLLAAGNRADILVQAPAACNVAKPPCSYSVQVYNEVDPSDLVGAFPNNLVTVNVSGTAFSPAMAFITKAPSFPEFLKDIADSEVTGTKTIDFKTIPQQAPPSKPAIHLIDGKQFDGEVGAVVLMNKVEEWKITNVTPGISHPFHIHINPFQVTEVFSPNDTLANGSPRYVTDKTGIQPGQCFLDPADPDTWKPCGGSGPSSKNAIWWDVFPIPSGLPATKADGSPINDADNVQIVIPGYFKMRSRFVDYSGYYVIHCHILAHEDRGMMTVVEVAPLASPYAHH